MARSEDRSRRLLVIVGGVGLLLAAAARGGKLPGDSGDTADTADTADSGDSGRSGDTGDSGLLLNRERICIAWDIPRLGDCPEGMDVDGELQEQTAYECTVIPDPGRGTPKGDDSCCYGVTLEDCKSSGCGCSTVGP
jgi:hypothetical protein